MEEDITILEERITMLKRHIKHYEESDCKTDIYYQLVRECKALENLLTRYKELEEENKELKAITNTYNSYEEPTPEDTRIVICDSRYFCNGTFIRKFIPKSKIKEKIQEITNMRDTTITSEGYNILNGEIVVLQDLLEEDD